MVLDWKEQICVKYVGEIIPKKGYGPVTEQGIWRIRNDQELRELYDAPDAAADVKRKMTE
jgi:hypothetical protein